MSLSSTDKHSCIYVAARGQRLASPGGSEYCLTYLVRSLRTSTASTIDRCLSVFPWALFRSTKSAVKLHALLDLRGSIPTFVHVSHAKLGDVNVLDHSLTDDRDAYWVCNSLPVVHVPTPKQAAVFVVATLGLVASVIPIHSFLPPEEEPLLVPDTVMAPSEDTIEIKPDAPTPTRPVVAHRVIFSGSVTSAEPVHIVAARLEAVEEAALIAPAIVVFANDLVGGRLDVSGPAGDNGVPTDHAGASGDHGEDGSNGGRIFLAAARVNNAILDASGGRGGSGTKGQAGRSGRDGDCAGFGDWVGATDGGSGGRGGNAGTGGDGGRITLIVSPEGFRGPEPVVRGGRPGREGQGGPGGRGGDGCTGLGGTQSPHPRGVDGLDGSTAPFGREGTVSRFALPISDVHRAIVEVATALGDPRLTNPQTLEGVIQRLTSEKDSNP